MLAFIPSRRIPTRDEWQHALDTMDMAGITLSLFPSLDVEHHSGFCPMVLSGTASGVEVCFYSHPLDEFATLIRDNPVLTGRVRPEHTAIGLFSGADMHADACANAACAGLISGFAAIAFDPIKDKILSSPELLVAEARMSLMRAEYGSEKPLTPEFVAQLEEVNGGPLPQYTITLETTPLDLDYLRSLVRPKE